MDVEGIFVQDGWNVVLYICSCENAGMFARVDVSFG